MSSDLSKERKMSKAYMRQVQHPINLNECLHTQNYYIELEMKDPDGKLLCQASMSYDQFVRLLICQSDVTVTLTKYRGLDGKLKEEKVPAPESVRDGILSDFGDAGESLKKRMGDLKQDIYEMLNSKKSPGKKALEQLFMDAKIVEDHLEGNLPYFTELAVEKIGEIQENAKSQLSIFAQNLLKVDLKPEDFTPMIESRDILPLPDKTVEPIIEQYEHKEREKKPVDEMSVMEVADNIRNRLHQIERAENKFFDNVNDKEGRKQLFGASASSVNNKVSICYVSYQGSSKIELDRAKKYLIFLQSIKKLSDFKTHYWFNEED